MARRAARREDAPDAAPSFRGRASPALLLATAALVPLAGCLDLDALRARAGDAGAAGDAAATAADAMADGSSRDCQGDVRKLVFWKLHLGQSDYATIKNPTRCAIELGGVQLRFDDIDEAFPEVEGLDCVVQLPAFRLEAGAEVRVHEHPLAGDISVLDNRLTACGADLSFNPMRGGVSYLCDGECASDTVIDVVAHHGETDAATPPELLYGQTFDSALRGVTIDTQESKQYRRVATEGAPPSFVASDWQLETRVVYASFESAVEVLVDGITQPFAPETGQTATFSSSSAAAIGDVALHLKHRGSDGRSTGLSLSLDDPNAGQTPSHVTFYARIDDTAHAGAYFDLQGGGFTAIRASFEPTGLGTDTESPARTEIVASEKQFYQLELRNIDWPAHLYDLYIDRVLVAERVPFLSNAFSADRLSLYSISAGSDAYWDEIELWQ
jgi:hypothetical protein